MVYAQLQDLHNEHFPMFAMSTPASDLLLNVVLSSMALMCHPFRFHDPQQTPVTYPQRDITRT